MRPFATSYAQLERFVGFFEFAEIDLTYEVAQDIIEGRGEKYKANLLASLYNFIDSLVG